MSDIVKCPVCSHAMLLSFMAQVLRELPVQFFYCAQCGLLKSEKPYWLKEAYAEAIAETDTGLVARNIANCRWLEPVLEFLFHDRGKFLDVAGGYGLLARLLRDIGFDCYSTDKYCKNIFAGAFEPADGFSPDAIFAFEVMEHLENPLQFLQECIKIYQCKTIFFSTQLFFNNQIPPKEWWYYGFETGQHITFYQPRTLSRLAETIGCHYYLISGNRHIFTEIKLSRLALAVLRRKNIYDVVSKYIQFKRKGKSKTWQDYQQIKENLMLHPKNASSHPAPEH